jgi:hypothetical protein
MLPRDWLYEIAPLDRVLSEPPPPLTQTITELHQTGVMRSYHAPTNDHQDTRRVARLLGGQG